MDNTVSLQLMVSSQSYVKATEVDLLIVSTHNNAYNAILGRPSLNKIGVIVSMPYLLMKFPTSQGVGQVQANQQMARQCCMASLSNCNLE